MALFDWKNLPFGYYKTNCNVRCYYRNGKWGKIETTDSEKIEMHMAATTLHYGQEAFEGLKAYRGKDGKIRLFRWEENAKRMQRTADAVYMAKVPDEIFFEAVKTAVLKNEEFVPPYESGATLYIRPLLIGTGPQVGVKPADEYLFVVFVTPVGPYFKEGFKPVSILITREFDRAAPQGVGEFKVGGNYAAGLRAMDKAHHEGYGSVLFLDAKEKKYIDECGPANFFGIKGNTYVTPKSSSILPSITNMSLMTLSEDMGMTVEKRQVPVEELAEFDETGACGTAAVITPISKIVDDGNGKEYCYGDGQEPGPVSTKLYDHLRGIQYGDEEDKHGWVTVLN